MKFIVDGSHIKHLNQIVCLCRKYNLTLQAYMNKKHVLVVTGFLANITNHQIRRLLFSEYESGVGTLNYIIDPLPVTKALVSPFYVPLRKAQRGQKNCCCLRKKYHFFVLRHNARHLRSIVLENSYVLFFLDHKQSADAFFNSLYRRFEFVWLGAWCGDKAIQ